MQEIQFKDKYHIYKMSLKKSETACKSIDEIFAFLKEEISIHPVATYIGEFDHFSHTLSLAEHSINENIINAKNILFCFGKELLVPEVLAVRPRSIGVAQMQDTFEISFMQAPNQAANESMQKWIKALSL